MLLYTGTRSSLRSRWQAQQKKVLSIVFFKLVTFIASQSTKQIRLKFGMELFSYSGYVIRGSILILEVCREDTLRSKHKIEV